MKFKFLLAAIFLPVLSFAQFWELVEDINQNTPNQQFWSSPRDFCEFQGDVYFSAFDYLSGRELYKYDGSQVSLEADIFPGLANLANFNSSKINRIVSTSNALYFIAQDSLNFYNLFRYVPGSGQSATIVDTLNLFNEGETRLYAYGDTVLYGKKRPNQNTIDIWQYDNANGKSTLQFGSFQNPIAGTTVGDSLFIITAGSGGMKLNFYSQGVFGLLATLSLGSGSNELVHYNGKLYFIGIDSQAGTELLDYDINTNMVSLVADLNPGSGSSFPRELTLVDNKLYFQASNGASVDVYEYDFINTPLVLPFGQNNNANNLTSFQNELYLVLNDPLEGAEFFRYTGIGNPTMAFETVSGIGGIGVTEAEEINGMLFLGTGNNTLGREPHTFDGTTLTLLDDVNFGSTGSNPNYFTKLGDKLVFSAIGDTTGNELFEYDGSTVNLVADIATDPFGGQGNRSSSPFGLVEFNNKVYFRALADDSRYYIFEYDGSSPVQEAFPGLQVPRQGKIPTLFQEFNDKLYCVLNDSLDYALYSVDKAGVIEKVQVVENALFENTSLIFNDELFLTVDLDTLGYELFKVDESGNLSLVEDIAQGANSSVPLNFAVFRNELYFRAFEPNIGSELYKYDGNSVSLVADIFPDTNTNGFLNSSAPFDLVVLNDHLFFGARGNDGLELYVYDGASAPTILEELNPGPFDSYLGNLTNINNHLYFWGDRGDNRGVELRRVTPINGTFRIDDMPDLNLSAMNTRSLQGSPFILFDNQVYTSANDGRVGRIGQGELYRFDPIPCPQTGGVVTANNGSLSVDVTAESYQWFNCTSGKVVEGETNSTFSPDDSDEYGVILINGTCSDTLACIIASSNDIDNTLEVQLHPNPTKDVAFINITGEPFTGDIHVLNVLGQEQLQLKVEAQRRVEIQLPEEKGLYIVELRSLLLDGTKRIKLIKH